MVDVANILFLDSPAGVGFSYSDTISDLYTVGDRRTAEDAYKFLVNWFERFPQYKHRDSTLLERVMQVTIFLSWLKLLTRKISESPEINLKGFMLEGVDA